jgi:hypothetical protein
VRKKVGSGVKVLSKFERERRYSEVVRLRKEGMTLRQVADIVGIHPSSVSHIQNRRKNYAWSLQSEDVVLRRLWADVDHVTQSLLGAAVRIEELTARLGDTRAIGATKAEVKKCLIQLSQSNESIRALRLLLKNILDQDTSQAATSTARGQRPKS